MRSVETYGARLALAALCVLAAPRLWAQGPPYQTDDPVPVDLHHYEFYIFGGMDGTTAEIDSTDRLSSSTGRDSQSAITRDSALGCDRAIEQSDLSSGGTGPKAFGLTDMELGTKIAFIKESKYVPQIGAFTMFEIPTGSYGKGLGVGKVWYKLPSGCRRMPGLGPLTAAPGIRSCRRPATGNFPYTGWLVNGPSARGWNWESSSLPRARGIRRGADGGFGDDRPGRLLSLQESPWRTVCLPLWPLRRRPDGGTTPMWGCIGPGGKTPRRIRPKRLDAGANEREGN